MNADAEGFHSLNSRRYLSIRNLPIKTSMRYRLHDVCMYFANWLRYSVRNDSMSMTSSDGKKLHKRSISISIFNNKLSSPKCGIVP